MMTERDSPTTERRIGRQDGLIEAAAWLEDAAGQHVRGSETWGWLNGAANFMHQRAEEISNSRDVFGYLRWTPTSCRRCGYEEADCTCIGGFVKPTPDSNPTTLTEARIRAAERERCARMCETLHPAAHHEYPSLTDRMLYMPEPYRAALAWLQSAAAHIRSLS